MTTLGYGEEIFSIPHGPSFKKLVDLFSESDIELCNLKLDKLLKLLRLVDALHFILLTWYFSASITKQKRQRIHSFELIDVERITLVTLQVICSVVFTKISQLHHMDHDRDEFQTYVKIFWQS